MAIVDFMEQYYMILCLETSSTVCSVALFDQGECKSIREDFSAHSHSSRLVPMVEEVLQENRVGFKNLSAIAVSAGPGSYTGLRIGVSSAKGFCDACNIPLIAVPTLQAMAIGFIQTNNITNGLVCPMFDARRMEVYYWLGDSKGNMVEDVKALVLNEHSFQQQLEEQDIYFIGNGSKKTSVLLKHKHAHFEPEFHPSARWLGPLAEERWKNGQVENLAYYEPFYLKDSESHLKPAPKTDQI